MQSAALHASHKAQQAKRDKYHKAGHTEWGAEDTGSEEEPTKLEELRTWTHSQILTLAQPALARGPHLVQQCQHEVLVGGLFCSQAVQGTLMRALMIFFALSLPGAAVCLSVGDVVRYNSPGKFSGHQLGVVTKTTAVDGGVTVHPLCVRNGDEEATETSLKIDKQWIETTDKKELVLYYDEDEPKAPLSVLSEDIQKVYDGEVSYTQRVIEDRISNPHGEHAEDLWLLQIHDDLVGISINVRGNSH